MLVDANFKEEEEDEDNNDIEIKIMENDKSTNLQWKQTRIWELQ